MPNPRSAPNHVAGGRRSPYDRQDDASEDDASDDDASQGDADEGGTSQGGISQGGSGRKRGKPSGGTS